LLILISHLFYLSQALTTLNLAANKIDARGARAIAQALERNQVRQIFLVSSSRPAIFSIYFRHSPHLTWIRIKLDMKVHEQLGKPLNEIKWN